MLFSALPVMAAPLYAELKNIDKVAELNLKLDDFTYELLQAEPVVYPIWLAEQRVYNEATILNPAGDPELFPGGWLATLNGGLPVGHVKANPDVLTALGIAQQFINDNYAGKYVIPSYNLNNVYKVYVEANVPGTWTKGYKLPETTVYRIKGNQEQVTFGNNGLDPNLPIADFQFMALKADLDALGCTYTIGAADANGNFPVVIHRAGVADVAGMLNAAGTDLYVNDRIYQYYDGQVVNPTGVLYDVATKTYTGNVADLVVGPPALVNVELSVETVKGAEEFVTILVEGILVVVEETTVPVTVNHHYRLSDGTVLTKTTTKTQPKATKLTIETVNPAWYEEVAEFKIQTAETKVTANYKKNANYLYGEQILEGYTVDLYYTAGAGATKADVDAAFAGVNAGVQNQAASLPATAVALPATGAANNFALLLSSAALVVLGFFFKK